jgi:voltage-gated potassium channel
MSVTAKKQVYDILESRVQQLPLGRFVAGTLILLILLNVIAAVLETDTAFFNQFGHALDAFAFFSVLIFTVEYILRVWCCTENPLFTSPVHGRLRYMATPLALIDLLVIAPFFLLPFLTQTPYIFWLIRFSRIFWILKIGHYSRATGTLVRVFKAKRGEILIALFIMMVLLILGSAMIYFAEHDAQPEKFSSVLVSMWWGIETMATIGYGDMVPITPLGKCISGVVALLGVGLFALPAGIFASGFMDEVRRNREERHHKPFTCPHCGKEIHDLPERRER